MTKPARERESEVCVVHVRFQLALLVVTSVLLAASFVGAEYWHDQPLHHVPTVIALAILARCAWKRGLSDVSFGAIVLFLWLHILGARYVYSFVPYDEWTRAWFGFSIDEAFHFTRNHYDRLVHVAYGVLAVVPQVEILRRKFGVAHARAVFVAVALVLSASALYEIAEWILAVVLSPETADKYNGQQGDMFDAQKDMLCALAGALATALFLRRGEKGNRPEKAAVRS